MNPNNPNLKKCNYCGEEIPAGAGRCPFCGSLLEVVVDAEVFKATEGQAAQDGEAGRKDAASGQLPANTSACAPAEFENSPGETPYPGAADRQRPCYNNPDGYRDYKRPPLSNGLKVFLTIIFTMIPGIGQLAGIITAIVFMNADDDADRKSFGAAILVASLVMFALACIGCFLMAVSFSVFRNGFQDFNY